MVKIYIELIRKGKITIDEVPEEWREAVRKEIEK
jgi:hypothetical protein